MIFTQTTLIEFKKTKFLKMLHDTELNGVWIVSQPDEEKVFIPINKVFSLQRGIVSYLQRYWRKRKRHDLSAIK